MRLSGAVLGPVPISGRAWSASDSPADETIDHDYDNDNRYAVASLTTRADGFLVIYCHPNFFSYRNLRSQGNRRFSRVGNSRATHGNVIGRGENCTEGVPGLT